MDSQTTVIISTYNRAQFIRQSLDSILKQTCKLTQIIVVDDGSTDGTQAVLAEYGNHIQQLRQENSGKSAALNLALPHVTGKYLWIFDDDDIALPDSLERRLSVMNGDGNLDFVYGSYFTAISDRVGNLVPQRLIKSPKLPTDEIFVNLLEGCFFAQPSLLVRTELYRRVGMFDQTLVRGQDYEMSLRLARYGRGTGINAATFLARSHDGIRGSSFDAHPASRREEKWFDAERKIFASIYRDLKLSEYLPGGAGPNARQSIPPSERRRAFLQRFTMMARRGFINETIADLEQALASDQRPLTPAEAALCYRALCVPRALDRFAADPVWTREVLRLTYRSPVGRQILRNFARGAIGAVRYGEAKWQVAVSYGRILLEALRSPFWRLH